MVERVPKTGGSEYRNDNPDLVMFFEKPEKCGVKEKVHQQFLEIKIITIKKFGYRARG